MTDRTDRFGFDILGPGGSLQDNGFKFGDADRRLLDRLLRIALESHVHDGVLAGDQSPIAAPSALLVTAGGGILAATRLYYCYTLVDAQGNESAGSPAVTIITPPAVADPSAPSPAYSTGGTLPPGSYTYIVSAYTTVSTLESRAVRPVQILLNSSTATGRVTLTMPSLPAGASGFNVYRKRPNSPRYYFLGSTITATYVDDGSVADDLSRGLPLDNTTNGQNAVTITLPGATPAVPVGGSWNLYRSTSSTNWDNSLLQNVVSGAVTYDDVGATTFTGNPPTVAQVVGSPPKIQLTNAAHVTGQLPPGLNVVPYVVPFFHPGLTVVSTLSFVWVCDFDRARIVTCRAYLGVDRMPAATNVIVDVNKYNANAATPAWATIYTTQANRPTVPVGTMVGTPTIPDVVTLLKGDILSVDIDQAGDGATPTDYDLVVAVLMYVQQGSETTSIVWP